MQDRILTIAEDGTVGLTNIDWDAVCGRGETG